MVVPLQSSLSAVCEQQQGCLVPRWQSGRRQPHLGNSNRSAQSAHSRHRWRPTEVPQSAHSRPSYAPCLLLVYSLMSSIANFLFLKFAIEPSKGLVVHDHVLFLKIQAEAFGLPLLRSVFALYITPSGMNSLMVSTVRCFRFPCGC